VFKLTIVLSRGPRYAGIHEAICMKTVQLVTSRLVLRSVEDADIGAVHALRSNQSVLKHIGPVMSEDEVRELMQQRRETWAGEDGQELSLLAETREGREFVGECVLRSLSASARQAEVGCALMPGYQGRGVGTEATLGVMCYAFEELGLHRVFAISDVANEAARLVLEKVGMTHEGVMRHNAFRDGEWCDERLSSMLEPEWRRLRPSFARYLG
jgi:RimJ/RimL family protein N-acetyltransferase